MKFILWLAQYLIDFLKDRNGILAAELKEVTDRHHDHVKNLEEMEATLHKDAIRIQSMEDYCQNIKNRIHELTAEVSELEIKRIKQLKEKNKLIDETSDHNVIREEL